MHSFLFTIVGEEIMTDFIMWNYDVPVSKSFASKTLAVNRERYRRIIKMHSEFNDLKGYQQDLLWRRSVDLCTAWSLAKLESCKTGTEQWAFENDGTHEMGPNSIASKRLNHQFKKVDLDVVNKLSGKFDIYYSYSK